MIKSKVAAMPANDNPEPRRDGRIAVWARKLFGRDAPPAVAANAEFDRVKSNWEALGGHDPLWAIVSAPEKRGNLWDHDEFFATGVNEIRHVFAKLKVLGIEVGRGRALDFGAGVGRLTQALAAEFERVDGVEVAASMLEKARALNRHPDRVTYLESRPDSLPCAEATYDFVFSNIVLQHLAIGLQRVYVREFIRVLKPGGIAMFQAPSRAVESEALHFRTPVETPRGTVTIDMNIFPRADVERTLRDCGARLLHAFPDVSAGDKFESLLYVATR